MKLIANTYKHQSEEFKIFIETCNKRIATATNLTTNETPRYHIIEFPKKAQLVKVVVDFKHYFSISIKYLQQVKDQNFEHPLDFLYREKLSQRFANYLSRIGLPEA